MTSTLDPNEWMRHPEVICYFAVLLWSLFYCYFRCKSYVRIALSLSAMSITWYYILTWVLSYKANGGTNLFDDAYVDVLEASHYSISSQLLTWVVISAIWIRDESVNYMLFGMLGAMASAFFVINPPPASSSFESLSSSRSSSLSRKMQRPANSSRSVPFIFVFSSILSLISIYKLKYANEVDFSFWLKGLHIFLVAPHIISRLIPIQVNIDKSVVFGALGLTICILHLKVLLSNSIENGGSYYSIFISQYTSPVNDWSAVSDCKKSITYDLILCSFFSLYTIYSQSSSILATIISAILLPVLTPGAVFSFYLAIFDENRSSFSSFHNRMVTYLQKSVAKRASGNQKTRYMWMNLGMNWHKSKNNYGANCQSLASTVGDAIFEENDAVLACGCGYGAELVFWKQTYKLGHVTGIDVCEEAADSFIHEKNVRLVCADASEIVSKFKGLVEFNKIVSLDSVYHFENKLQFFKDCFSLLSVTFSQASSRRAVCVTDLAIIDNNVPFILSVILRFMNVSVSSLWTVDQYKEKLESLGYVNVNVRSLNKDHHVLDGWFNRTFSHYLDYVIVEATYPASRVCYVKRPCAAVIGTGLAGLVTAKLLSSTHEVTIYEANGKCGLAGHGQEVYGEIVDVPLRIIGEGYYSFCQNFITSLNVALLPIRNDFLTQSNIGNNAPKGSPSVFCYTNNFLYNMISIVPHFFDVYRFNKIVYNESKSDVLDINKNADTWGEWLVKHGYNIDRYRSSGDKSSKNKFDSNSTDSYIIWILMGEFSWMLSCTYEQVLNYPASIILTFVVSLGWGRSLADTILSSSRHAGRMLRVKPSMKVLEDALTYGLEVNLNTRVQNLDSSRIIHGKAFDCVIVATEASAIKHILKPSVYPQVFSQIEYQPSSIVLHTDPCLMPEDRRNWLAFNVAQDGGEDMCQLTAWLNEYYPEGKFPCNLYQTWNPHKKPDPATVVSTSYFLRVVHNKDTPKILSGICRAQGTHGIYYAGAYAVEGMGLLEQAAVSAQRVADLISKSRDNSSLYKMKELDSILSDLGSAKSQLSKMMPRYNNAANSSKTKPIAEISPISAKELPQKKSKIDLKTKGEVAGGGSKSPSRAKFKHN